MKFEQVIALLADGEVHSGEELGNLLGVSRTAVWKQLKKFEGLGLELVSVKGRGYRLEGGLELLDPQRLADLSGQVRPLVSQLDVLGSMDSTNNLAMQRAREGRGHGYVCLAEHQTAGRGRHGRQWVSPYGRNIYLSLCWRFAGGAAVLEGLSLAVGVAIVRALSANGIGGVQLKWPNDLLWREKKVAGVLLEMMGDASGECHVIVGVGLNVHMTEGEAGQIDQPWASLSAINPGISRNRLAMALINELIHLLSGYQDRGFAGLREEWESLNAYAGEAVEIRAGDQVTRGVALGVNDAGALRLKTDDGEQLIVGGEASLRRPG